MFVVIVFTRVTRTLVVTFLYTVDPEEFVGVREFISVVIIILKISTCWLMKWTDSVFTTHSLKAKIT